MKKVFFVGVGITLAAMIGAVGCTKKSEPVKVDALYRPVITLQELMASVIDPHVDPIWNAVSTVSTAEGIVENKPKTDAEWQTLRNHALTLIEVGNLLVIEGRPVAAAGANTSSHAAELGPADISKAIDANRADFINNARAFQDAAKLALAAIDEKDPEKLLSVGGQIEHACEQCHSQFWYPNDKRPTAALDIGLKGGDKLYLQLRKSS